MNVDGNPAGAATVSDRAKWEADSEIALKEREQATKELEARAKVEELKRSRWASPLFLALLAAALAATGNAAVALKGTTYGAGAVSGLRGEITILTNLDIALIWVWFVLRSPRYFIFSALADVEQVLGDSALQALRHEPKLLVRHTGLFPTDRQSPRCRRGKPVNHDSGLKCQLS
jgi:hypothetical protein